eukprot:TRINITY_DN19557_c0_g1_i1.p1 TRINITY_DN19557_c0_g1~~TRINITY_DN19557_c0_g1_i1.p1  ORF type:complete len:321 (+),score=62.05 TRINITY_DN19557_c0_g1_i1:145-1107(+)
MAVAGWYSQPKLFGFSKPELIVYSSFVNRNISLRFNQKTLFHRIQRQNSRTFEVRCNTERSDFDSEEDVEKGDEGYRESFWGSKKGQERYKDLEDMRDLVKEAEKLQEEDAFAQTSNAEDIDEEKKKRLRYELAKRAKEQAERRKTAGIMFLSGQRAYGKGMYRKSVELLENALQNVSESSLFGGEIQIWLAMAYDAQNRHSDCIALYESLEDNHPVPAIRKKAAELRYILDAPKLKITEAEMVTVPLLSPYYESSKDSWGQRYRKRMRRYATSKGAEPTKDYYSDFWVWKRPEWEKSPYFWVAVAMWLTLVGVALVFQD